MKTTTNTQLQKLLKVRYEYHGYNGERHITVPIMYDPKTGYTYDVGDIYDIEGEDDVQYTEQVKVQNQ